MVTHSKEVYENKQTCKLIWTKNNCLNNKRKLNTPIVIESVIQKSNVK